MDAPAAHAYVECPKCKRPVVVDYPENKIQWHGFTDGSGHMFKMGLARRYADLAEALDHYLRD